MIRYKFRYRRPWWGVTTTLEKAVFYIKNCPSNTKHHFYLSIPKEWRAPSTFSILLISSAGSLMVVYFLVLISLLIYDILVLR